MTDQTRSIRIRFAAWYALSTAALMLVLGSYLFALLARDRSRELSASLSTAVHDIVQTAKQLGIDDPSPQHAARTAIDDLDSDDVPLFLFDSQLKPYSSNSVPAEAQRIAARAFVVGSVKHSFSYQRATWRALAQRFRIRQRDFVVVAISDETALEEHYARLAELFGGSALLGILIAGVFTFFFSERAIRPIQASAEAVRRFMADAAHELRTPVAAVRTNAEVALRATTDPDLHARLAIIAGESQRLTTLVNDLLTLARADAAQPELRREAIFLDDIVSDAVASFTSLATVAGSTLCLGRYEQAKISGDPRHVRDLINVLLDNAIKYTHEGSITVDVFAEEGAGVFCVRDTGIGIAPEDLPRVFDRFFRSDSARRTAPGSGVGLAIAKWVADSHRATITVSSEPDEGTTFRVNFPLIT